MSTATATIRGQVKPRTAATPVIEGMRISRLEDLDRVVGSREFIAADLSLGPWRGCQAATELESQVGLIPESSFGMDLAAPGDSMPTYADFVGKAIDSESNGDRVTLDALRRAANLAEVLLNGPRSLCLVFAPCPEIGWDRHDSLLIRFLAEALTTSEGQLILVSGGKEEPSPLPDCEIRWNSAPRFENERCHSVLGLIPGIVDPAITSILEPEMGSLGSYWPLNGGGVLLGPEWRRRPSTVPRNEYDRLAAAISPIGWLAAYAQCYGNNYHVSPSFLREQARLRLTEGGHEIALRLLDRAFACSHTPEDVAKTQCYAQGARIALMRFKDAALCSDPPRSVPAVIRSFLLQCKGWGLVMCDQSDRAKSYLHEARLLASDQGSREHLYLLNISALAAYKQGDFEGALQLEQCIEKSLAAQKKPDWHLWYINSINSARLYFRSGANDKAAAYYERAFDTTLGVRSESDKVYANVCSARVLTKQSGPASGLWQWLRAGLHWVTSYAPETLAPRVTRAIVGRPLAAGEHSVETISAAFIEQILPTVEATGISFDDSLFQSPPVFLQSGYLEAKLLSAMGRGIGVPGCGVVALPCVTLPVFSGGHYDRLRSLLWLILREVIPGDWDQTRTVVIDDRFGCEIPVTKAELVNTCLRLGVPRMCFCGEVLKIDESLRHRLEMQSLVRLGRAVDNLEFSNDGVAISFRRYLPSKFFTGTRAALLAEIVNGPISVEELGRKFSDRSSALLARLRTLESLRVLAIELENGAV